MYLWQSPIIFLNEHFKRNVYEVMLIIFVVSALTTHCVEDKLRYNKHRCLIPILFILLGGLAILGRLIYNEPTKWHFIF